MFTAKRISFWYHMYGASIGSIAVYIRTSYEDTTNGLQMLPNGNLTGDQGDFWWQFDQPIDSNGKDFKIVIEGMIGTSYQGDGSIDDISFSEGCIEGGKVPGEDDAQIPTHGSCEDDSRKLSCDSGDECFYTWERCNFNYECSDKSDEKGCGTDCTFESDQCGWELTPGSKVEWVRSTGPPYTQYSGPAVDHTLGTASGHFMLYKANTRYTYSGDPGYMRTLPYQHSGADCKLTFWYHQYGLTMGTLDIFIKYPDHTSSKLWTKTGDQGNSWLKATVPIGTQDEFSIVFEGLRGTSIYGDIGIDDIEFVDCYDPYYERPCDTGSEFQCLDDKSCLPLRYHCDYGPNCKDGSDENNCIVKPGDCHFDDSGDWCSWEQYDDDDFDWSLSKATAYGPKHDHTTVNTTGNSRFAYSDSSLYSPGDIARISTPSNTMFPASKDLCYIRFWFYMYSLADGVGTLKLYTESTTEGNANRFLMWQLHGSQGDRWNYVNRPIGNTHDFKVVFEVTMGDRNASDIAIDDVTFTASCLNPDNGTLIGSCPRNHLYCPGDRVCIRNELVNDGEVDCKTDCYDELPYRNNCELLEKVVDDDSGSNIGAIVGGVIGGIAFAVLLVIVIVFAIKFLRQKSSFGTFGGFGRETSDRVKMSGVTDPYDVAPEPVGQDPYSLDNPMYGNGASDLPKSKSETDA